MEVVSTGRRAELSCATVRHIRDDAISGNRLVPRSTVDWDTSQADDFRRRGEPWTIKRTRLERVRARRSGGKGLARWQDVTPAQDRRSAAAVARGRPGDRLARTGRHSGDADR